MSVSEQQRHQLFSWFEEAMGSERAATMMDLLPPVGWADVATKPDVLRLEAELRRLTDDVGGLTAKVDGVEGRLRAEIATTTRAQITWLLASQASVIGVVAAFAALG